MVWQSTDPDRCGPSTALTESSLSLATILDSILAVPPVVIETDAGSAPASGTRLENCSGLGIWYCGQLGLEEHAKAVGRARGVNAMAGLGRHRGQLAEQLCTRWDCASFPKTAELPVRPSLTLYGLIVGNSL
jgi:hypothetical protein